MPAVYVFVEGESDAVALETIARRRGTGLRAHDVQVVPIHGVTNIERYLDVIDAGASVAGLCDAGEQRSFRRAFGRARDRLEVLGCFVCEPDLETELINAVGVDATLGIVTRERELESFRTLQHQPAHRERAIESQLHRFIGTKSGRKLRYARLLAEAVDLSAVPAPLDAVLAAVSRGPVRDRRGRATT